MQTSTLPRENGTHFPARRGHYPQLSISDDSHHVTEAIGHMYDDEGDGDSRRMSGGRSRRSERSDGVPRECNDGGAVKHEDSFVAGRMSTPRKRSNGNVIIGPNSQIQAGIGKGGGAWEQGQSLSPSSLHARERSPSDTALSPFPLNNIDYESSPAAVAKELSNLQALRRMSMNADLGATDDPDLPQLNAAAVPATPSHSEDDSSRLFWVPARLHPELAPKEFKTFLESRAEQIKRRSGELSQFSSFSSSLSGSPTSSDSGLRRKQSMLSRQIHSPVGYQDGADRLEKKKSSVRGSPDLEELESLVSETGRLNVEPGAAENGDIILPSVPSASLKRSKRTNYRRGGSLQNRSDRGTYAQRMARKAAGEETAARPAMPDAPPLPSFSTEVSNLASTLSFASSPSSSEPLAAAKKEAHNFSRPASIRSSSSSSSAVAAAAAGATSSVPTTFDGILAKDQLHRFSTASTPERRPEPMAHSQPRPESSHDKRPVPQIIEVPPAEDSVSQQPSHNSSPSPPVQPPIRHPERSSSREAKIVPPPPAQRHGVPGKQPPLTAGSGPSRAAPHSQQGSSMRMNQPLQSLEQPSLLPGNNSGTQELTFIPTLTVDKRADHKKKDEPKKSGWGWLLGKEEDKDKSDKLKHKLNRPTPSDNTRLDVLQTSIDGQKGRESIVLDRESMKLEEERKKESARKSAGSESKKEKDSFLSSIFGGKKGKEKDTARKNHRLSPEPVHRELKPDIDYHWTRFSILEERAIYRLAHIKLANPRRSLYSQVLLSNFMYSYLAKVQQMHPQMNLPTSARQQRSQQLQQQQQHQQQHQQQKSNRPDEFAEYQHYQAQAEAQTQGMIQEQVSQAEAQQHGQYAPQQVYQADQNAHAYSYDPNDQRPGSRDRHAAQASNNNHNTSGFGTGQQYYHQQHRPYDALDDGDGDDDDDMW